MTRGLRHLLRLPQSATTEFFYTPTSGGGLGLQSLVEMHQALQVAHAWQMLHSKDPAIAAVARSQVCQVVRKRYRLVKDYWVGREDELVRTFLNSKLTASPHATVMRRSGDIGSLWVDVQRIMSTNHVNLEERIDVGAADPLALRLPHLGKWLDHKSVLRHVKLHMKIRHQTRWKSLVDQGKTARVHGGLGSKFVSTGAGLSDAEHRFGIQARLNQVDTNSVLKRITNRVAVGAPSHGQACTLGRIRAQPCPREKACDDTMALPDAIRTGAEDLDVIRIGSGARLYTICQRDTNVLELLQSSD